jgi:hypothetical protein
MIFFPMKTCEMCGEEFKGSPKQTLCKQCREKLFGNKILSRPLKYPEPLPRPEPVDPHLYARMQIVESLRVHDAELRARRKEDEDE